MSTSNDVNANINIGVTGIEETKRRVAEATSAIKTMMAGADAATKSAEERTKALGEAYAKSVAPVVEARKKLMADAVTDAAARTSLSKSTNETIASYARALSTGLMGEQSKVAKHQDVINSEVLSSVKSTLEAEVQATEAAGKVKEKALDGVYNSAIAGIRNTVDAEEKAAQQQVKAQDQVLGSVLSSIRATVDADEKAAQQRVKAQDQVLNNALASAQKEVAAEQEAARAKIRAEDSVLSNALDSMKKQLQAEGAKSGKRQVSAGGSGGSGILSGIGTALSSGGSMTGGVAGGVMSAFGAVATLDLTRIISEITQLGVQTGKAAIAADEMATNYARQKLAAENLAGGQVKLNSLMEAFAEASGGALDQAAALQNVIQLQALGFANSATEIKKFVTAARGISLAMGGTVESVANDIALAIGNLSTRRLDQLGLSISEVTKRTDELQKANAGMTRQAAFQQAILESATKKFGALAEATQAQKSPLEKLGADWNNFSLIMGQVVKPSVDAVATAFDNLLKSAQKSAEEIKKNQAQNTTLPLTSGDFKYGSSDETAPLSVLEPLKKRFQEYVDTYHKMLDAGEGNAEELNKYLDLYTQQLHDVEISISRLKSSNMLASGDLPQGAPDVTAKVTTQSPLQRFLDENVDMIVEHEQKKNAIYKNAINQEIAADNEYRQAVIKSNKDFDQQLSEQNADHNRQMLREEEDYNREVEKVKNDALDRDAKAIRDVNQQIDKEKRDAGQEQARWQRDLNDSIEKNNSDLAETIRKSNRDFDERQAKDKEESSKKIKDINEKFAEDTEKAARDHADNLMDAAAHLDAWAVYKEQKKFLKESEEREKAHTKDLDEEKDHLSEKLKDNQESHDQDLEDLKKANVDRNAEEKAAYDKRVSDANDALEQQISDQQDALAQQLDDAKTADDQRLKDMQTAHENQKNQEILDYGLQLDREKSHHKDQLDELDTQHNNRIEQIKQQQFKEQTLLENEWNKQLAKQGVASANYAKAQEILQETSIALFMKWWKTQNDIMLGVQPKPGDKSVPAEFQPMLTSLQTYWTNLRTQLGTAVATSDTAEITRLSGLIKEVETAITQLGGTVGEPSGGIINPSSVDVGNTVDPAVVRSSGLSAASIGGAGALSVSMGDITIHLGDIGNRTNNEVKQLVGEAMIDWVNKASNYASTSRW